MENLESEKDKMLWREAKKRVGFKNHLITYLVVNGFFWIMWYFIDGKTEDHGGVPWPAFSTVGWGFGIFWHFAGTYLKGDKVSQVEKEFQKLKKKQEN